MTAATDQDPVTASRWAAVAPAGFVLLWSTGFVGAKYGLPDTEPFTFLAVRMGIAAVVLGGLALALGGWRLTRAQVGAQAVSGLLLHAGYLGGVFWAISRGVPAGTSAVVVSLQPVLVATVSAVALGERLLRSQWLGLVVGVAGVGLVVGPGLARTGGGTAVGIASCVVALLAGTAGTLHQKRRGGATPLLGGTAVQYAAAGLAVLAAALLTEDLTVRWTLRFALALTWLVLVLSVGAVLLLMWLLRRGSATGVSALYYLVPPATALEAWVLFRETLGPVSLAGVAVVAVGVALVVRPRRGGAPPVTEA